MLICSGACKARYHLDRRECDYESPVFPDVSLLSETLRASQSGTSRIIPGLIAKTLELSEVTSWIWPSSGGWLF